MYKDAPKASIIAYLIVVFIKTRRKSGLIRL